MPPPSSLVKMPTSVAAYNQPGWADLMAISRTGADGSPVEPTPAAGVHEMPPSVVFQTFGELKPP